MARGKELCVDLRKGNVNVNENYEGYKALFKQFLVPVSTVQSLVKKYRQSQMIESCKERGRKQKLTLRDSRKVVLEVNLNPRITRNPISNSLSTLGIEISKLTLHRTLKKKGFTGCRQRN